MESSEDLNLDSLLDLIDEDGTDNFTAECEEANINNSTKGNDLELTSEKCQSNQISLVHSGETSSEDEEDKECLSIYGQEIKEKIKPRSVYLDHRKTGSKTWKSKADDIEYTQEEPLDKLIGIRIKNPKISFDTLESLLKNRRIIRLSLMKNFIKNNDIEGDFVTICVVVRKIPPKTARTGDLYSIWKLSDLKDTEKIVSLFLFGKVHTELWKLAVGTVVGLLNPVIMPQNEKDADNYCTLKLDNHKKLMNIGTSKDFGYCKSKRKDGTPCTSIVNMATCVYCVFHIKKEYQKIGISRRSDIQSSWSGTGLCLKNKNSSLRDKVLKNQNFFYGGQTFVPLGRSERKVNSVSKRDQLTLTNLNLKNKAALVYREEKPKNESMSKIVSKLKEMHGDSISKTVEKNSEFINNQLLMPSAGSRNLLQHMIKGKPSEEKRICMGSPRDLMKQNILQIRSSKINKKDDNTILTQLQPVLGKGWNSTQCLSFDMNSSAVGQYAKLRAIQKIKEKGPIKRKNPNDVKSNPEPKKIKTVLENSFEENQDARKMKEEDMLISRLGCIDLKSEKIQNILNRKSSHAYEIEMAEMEREAAYFDRLERKEAMEEKMCATKEIVCDVVSCKQCRYTAHKAADRCKEGKHALVCHKAIKRFFECQDCKFRTDCFNRFPRMACRKCGSSRFERTGMIKIRAGPKLDSETFRLTEEDELFLNSL